MKRDASPLHLPMSACNESSVAFYRQNWPFVAGVDYMPCSKPNLISFLA